MKILKDYSKYDREVAQLGSGRYVGSASCRAPPPTVAMLGSQLFRNMQNKSKIRKLTTKPMAISRIFNISFEV